MSDEIVFYTNPRSRGRMVRWMLEEVGQPYRTELLAFDGLKTPAYLAINPMGKIPALTHGSAVLTEVSAICAYLADAFPQSGLAPPSASPRRAPYYRWLFFCAGPLEAAITNTILGVVVPPDRKGMTGYGSLSDVLDTIEAAVDGKAYLDGEAFTAADLFLCAQLTFGKMFGTIEDRPAFTTYREAHGARPASVRARDIDNALIAKA